MKKRLAILMGVVFVAGLLQISFISGKAETGNIVGEEHELPAVIMVVGSSQVILKGEKEFVDEDPSVMPVLKDDRLFVPQAYLEKVLDTDIDPSDYRCLEEDGVTYIPLREAAEGMGWHVYYHGGVIWFDIEPVGDWAIEASAGWHGTLYGLPVIGTQEKLNELLEEQTVHFHSGWDTGWDFIVEESAAFDQRESAPAAAKQNAEYDSGDYSETNTQVAGVDEGDIIKTDGKYIYYAVDNKVFIVQALPAQQMKMVETITCSEEATIQELYIDDDFLLVVSQSYDNSKFEKDYKVLDYWGGAPVTQVEVYSKNGFKKLKTVEVEGSYQFSRKIENAFYLVANMGANQLYSNDFITPRYVDSTGAGVAERIALDSCYYFPEAIGIIFTNVAGIDLSNLSQKAQVESYLGSGDNLYVSQQHLYLTTTQYSYANEKTHIYKFKLEDGKVTYATRGKVYGTVLNQFSMDEHKGYFRIATTAWAYGGTVNNLYILDKNLNLTGEVVGLAQGEQIYSVRYMGDRAYMVTFKTVDPLFAIDLSNPANPKVMGMLKIPGYSDYLHPYDETHLIGFGMDTFESGDMAYQKGMKLSMFDVSDIENPKELFNATIGDRGTSSDLLRNHKALLFSKEKNLLAFPVEVYVQKDRSASPFTSGEFSGQGAYVYEIDMEEGFMFKDCITHIQNGNLYDYNYHVNRAIYIGDTLYTVSNRVLLANGLSDMKEVGKIELK